MVDKPRCLMCHKHGGRGLGMLDIPGVHLDDGSIQQTDICGVCCLAIYHAMKGGRQVHDELMKRTKEKEGKT